MAASIKNRIITEYTAKLQVLWYSIAMDMNGRHKIQKKLLDIAKLEDLSRIKQKDLVWRVGCDYSSQIAHHMSQLLKRGDLVRTADGKIIAAPIQPGKLIRLPVMGEADCGEATKFADNVVQDYLVLSDSVLDAPRAKASYALVARGESMNRAQIAGNKPINEGDYVIVEKKDAYVPDNGDYVVSVFDGMANIKKFTRENERIVLSPESMDSRFAPIIIAREDEAYYRVVGKVVDVVKGTER
jgi:SOS-response transcriptional repressor LexA